MSDFSIEWKDRGREPKCKPDPEYPDGKDIDISLGVEPTCTYKLPYPAKRCGLYIVECQKCGRRDAITTAGRPDDPRRITVPCLTHTN